LQLPQLWLHPTTTSCQVPHSDYSFCFPAACDIAMDESPTMVLLNHLCSAVICAQTCAGDIPSSFQDSTRRVNFAINDEQSIDIRVLDSVGYVSGLEHACSSDSRNHQGQS
jgi:hypothetical protein